MDVFDLAAKITLDTSEYERGLAGLGTLAGGAARAVSLAFMAATGAVIGFGATSVKAGAEFDKSMAQVAATLGTTVEGMENEVGHASTTFGEFNGNLREFAQFMGANTAFSATQAADALNYMALAGYDAQKSMDMLPNVLNLAAAGTMDLATASDMITDAQTALGLSMEQTTELVDRMARTASRSNTSVSQMGNAILTIGGTAKFMNGTMFELADGEQIVTDSTTELSMVLGVLADNGIKGSEAGTHLRNALLKLSGDQDTKELMKEMGVAIFDAEGKMRSFADIFPELSAAMEDMTDEQKLQFFSDAFNVRDVASMNALLGTSRERWAELAVEITNAQGAAAEMAATQLDNLAGDVTIFKSALEGAQIAISDRLTPTLREFVQMGTEGVSNISTAFKENGLEGAMGAFGEWLSGAANKFLEAVPMIVSAAGQLISSFGKGIIDNADVIIGAAEELLQMFLNGIIESENSEGENKAVEIIMNIVDMLIRNIPLIASAAQSLIRQLGQGLSDAITSLMPVVTNIIIEIANFLTDPASITALLQAGMDIVLSIVDGLLEALPALINALPTIIDNVVNALLGAYPIIINGITSLINSIAQNLPTLIQSIASALPTIIRNIANAITQNLPIIMQAVISLVQTIAQSLPQIIISIVQMLPQIMDDIANALISALPQLIDGITLMVNTIAQQLPTLIQGLLNALPTIIQLVVNTMPMIIRNIANAIIQNLPVILRAIVSLVQSVARSLPDIIMSIVEMLPEILGEVVNALVSALPQLIEGIVSISTMIAEQLPEIMPILIDAIIGTLPMMIEMFINALITLLPALIDGYIQISMAIAENLPTIAKAIIDALPSIVQSIVTGFFGVKDGVLNVFGEMFLTLGNAFAGWYDSVLTAMGEWLANIVSKIETWYDTVMTGVGGFFANIINGLSEWYDSTMTKIGEFIVNVIDDITQFKDDIVKWFEDLIDKIKGFFGGIIDDLWTSINTEIPAIIEGIENFFDDLVDSAWNWGADLIGNFIDGVKSMVDEGIETIEEFAEGIADFIHFSEPEKGPLANFHTFAPDMMDLFIQGIRENEGRLQDQIADSFDFRSGIVDAGNIPATNGGKNGLITPAPREVTVVLELDKTQFAKTVFQLNEDETQRLGVALANV